jgi:hypothetical protein
MGEMVWRIVWGKWFGELCGSNGLENCVGEMVWRIKLITDLARYL